MPNILDELAGRLLLAKADEAKAKANRIAVEEVIAACIHGPDRGQKTVTLDDGTKLTVERGFNYKVDDIQSIILWCNNNGRYSPIKEKTTRELDEKGYEWFREHDVDAFKVLSQHVTVTPKKVAITIKEKKA